MHTAQHLGSASIAALVAGFPRGPRIAFAPEMGAGSGPVAGARPNPVKKDAAKKDDDGDLSADKMDKLLAVLQTFGENQAAINDRLDALEGKKADASKKDTDDLTEAEKEAKADASGLSGIDREMADIKARMPYAERQRAEAANDQALAKIQWRADSVFNLHGKQAPAPMAGETVMAYRLRVLREHQKFSPTLKSVDLSAIARADEAGFSAIETQIFADSEEASKRPAGPEDGGFTSRTKVDPLTGSRMTEYFGRNTYVKGLSALPQRFQGFRIEPRAY